MKLHVASERQRQRPGIECDHADFHAQLVQLIVVLLQLQQVLTAGESAEMAVKDQQQPSAVIVRQSMLVSVRIVQGERHRSLPGQIVDVHASIVHESLPGPALIADREDALGIVRENSVDPEAQDAADVLGFVDGPGDDRDSASLHSRHMLLP